MNGFLCVHKPRGPSSFKIISQIRRILNIKKAGHCGTLDPEAEGLLVVALGFTTRLLQYVQFEPKRYTFGIQFGSETDSFDIEGTIVASGGPTPAENTLRGCLQQFTGQILQIPPGFSAIKVDGVRAYTLARKGEAPQLEARPVTIDILTLDSYDSITGYAVLSACCSSGTYIRSLVRDIAHACSTYGTAQFIRRTSVGTFTLEQAVDLDTASDLRKYCIPAERIFNSEEIIEVDDEQYQKIIFGQTVAITAYQGTASCIFASKEGRIVAVLRNKTPGYYHPDTVLVTGAP